MPNAQLIPDVETKDKTRGQRPHIVVIHNDDEHSDLFVMEVLMRTCAMNQEQAFEVMKEIHEKGKGIAFRGLLELCELKQEQIRTFRDKAAQELASAPNTELAVTVEPE